MYLKYDLKTLILLLVGVMTIATHLFSQEPDFDLPLDELIALGEKFPDKGYLDQVLYGMESIKNFWIQEILFEGMDQASRNELNDIIRYHNYFYRKLSFWQKISGSSSDSLAFYQTKVDSLRNSIIQTKPEYTFFLKVLQPLTIKVIQKSYLQDRQAVLDYCVTENHLYIFGITKDTVAVVKSDVTRDFILHGLTQLLRSLAENNNLFQLTFDVQLAHELYQKIFEPVEKLLKDINALIIIPDEIMLGFPYECLVTALHSPKYKKRDNVFYDEFRDLTFLINKYAISYNYSLTALDPEFLSLRQKRKLNRKLLTMSEIKGIDYQPDSTEMQWDRQATIFGYEEVLHISRLLWLHQNIRGEEATEAYFKNHSANYRWIYLSLPGLLNNIAPASSALLFSKSRYFNEDGELRMADIFHCKLSADLITLSGSEVKPVSSTRKAGVVGIPQTFLLTGVQSVMFTLWRINDVTVSRFMTKYYWELKYKRQTNTLALQYAKITSLKDTFEYQGREISRAHPYFWAAYVLIGNANIRPPTFSTIPPVAVVLIVYVCAITISLVIVRKTMATNQKSNST